MENLFTEEIGGKIMSIQSGKVAKQASGSVAVSYTHLTLPTMQ